MGSLGCRNIQKEYVEVPGRNLMGVSTPQIFKFEFISQVVGNTNREYKIGLGKVLDPTLSLRVYTPPVESLAGFSDVLELFPPGHLKPV